MTDLLKIKAKITALLAKAEGTDNAFEAATFMAKVNELLEKHQIELYELGEDGDQMGHQRGEFNMYASMTWGKSLANQIAIFYGASTVWWKEKNHLRYDIIGRESARITAELMMPFIISQVRQRAGMMSKQTGKTRAICEREVASALTLRIHSEIKKDESRRAEHQSNMLVPVGEIDAYKADTYGKLKTGNAKVLKYTATAREHADSIAIRRQAPNAAGTKLIG